jgi:hypothetical protein
MKCGLMGKIVLSIKPHLIHHENWSQELNSKDIFGFNTLIEEESTILDTATFCVLTKLLMA